MKVNLPTYIFQTTDYGNRAEIWKGSGLFFFYLKNRQWSEFGDNIYKKP